MNYFIFWKLPHESVLLLSFSVLLILSTVQVSNIEVSVS